MRKKVGILFGCEIYSASFYQPQKYIFMSRDDADRLKQIELEFLKFISAVKAQIRKPEPCEKTLP